MVIHYIARCSTAGTVVLCTSVYMRMVLTPVNYWCLCLLLQGARDTRKPRRSLSKVKAYTYMTCSLATVLSWMLQSVVCCTVTATSCASAAY
jgi:hypothetical protein